MAGGAASRRFGSSRLRALQRRLQDRRALRGPDQEARFPQEHPPGREAQTDITRGKALGATIAGQPGPRLLLRLILSHSGRRCAGAAGGETFLALKRGLRNALRTLGGVPEAARPDNAAALAREIRRSRARALNGNYAALLDRCGLRSTRINRGKSHGNGAAGHARYRIEDAMGQALILRGSRDFHTAGGCACFVWEMAGKRNRLAKGKPERETACLRPLPPAPMPEYANCRSKARRRSAIQSAGRSCGAPSRLTGQEAQVRP